MSKIGLRNIKTALSVFLCIILFDLFNRQYPFYACIAAISCMKECPSSTKNAGKYRLIGTCIGAFTGIVFYLYFSHSAIFCAIGIVIVIYLCNLFEQQNSVIISCIVFIAIMTNLKGMPSDKYVINRILDTFIGIIIAISVDKLLNLIDFDKFKSIL